MRAFRIPAALAATTLVVTVALQGGAIQPSAANDLTCVQVFQPDVVDDKPKQVNGSGPHLVTNERELVWISEYQDATVLAYDYLLTKNLDLGHCLWSPIGTFVWSPRVDEPFAGNFDGGHFFIEGLKVFRPTSGYSAMFGNVGAGASISSTHLRNADVSGLWGSAGLVGANFGLVEMSSVRGEVFDNGDGGVGLLVGNNEGTVRFSFSAGSVVSDDGYSGGLVGANYAGKILDSYSSASVTVAPLKWAAGGLVGETVNGEILRSFAAGAVSSESSGEIGGLAGYSSQTDFESTFATGTVTVSGGVYIGGLIGGAIHGDVSNSFALGDVSAAAADYSAWGVGGLIGGHETSGVVLSSHAIGAVDGNWAVGGLIGYTTRPISDSFARGSVTGDEDTGGLIGRLSKQSGVPVATVSRSWASGAVTGGAYTGGLVGGVADEAQISQSLSTGPVSGVSLAGGLVGYTRVFAANIEDSYSTSAVTAWDGAGGLVGANRGAVTRSYSIGQVTADSFAGGLIGANDVTAEDQARHEPIDARYNVVTDSFWNVEGSGQEHSVIGLVQNSNTGAKTTSQMKTFETFNSADWGIVEDTSPDGTAGKVWGLDVAANCGYPFLWWQFFSVCDLPAIPTLADEMQRLVMTDSWLMSEASAFGADVLIGPVFSGQSLQPESVIWGYNADLNDGLPFLWWQQDETIPEQPTPSPVNSSFEGPVVTSISPSVAAPGATVVMTGSRLDGVTAASIDGKPLELLSVSATSLSAKLPNDLSPGTKDVVLTSSFGTVRLQSLLSITRATTAAGSDGAGQDSSLATPSIRRISETEAKMYVRDVVGAGKVQLMLNGRELGWVRAVDATDPKLRVPSSGPMAGRAYFVRTAQLVPGRNVLEIYVAGERVRRVVYSR